MSSRDYFHATRALARELGLRPDARDESRIGEGWNNRQTPIDVARTLAVSHGMSGAGFATRLGYLLASEYVAPPVRLALILSAPPMGGNAQ